MMAQYGVIEKCIINRNKEFTPKNSVGPCYSAYITYSSAREAAIAILAIDMFEYDSRKIRASFGTTKYCSFFLKGLQCKNKDCLYMHKDQPSSRILTKEIMSINNSLYQEQEMIAYKIANLGCVNIVNFNRQFEKYRCKSPIFPQPDTIFYKKFQFQEHTLMEKQELEQSSALITESINTVKPKVNKIVPSNRFKFIPLLYDGKDLPSSFNTMEPTLYEDNLQMQKEEEKLFLSKYNQVIDCIYSDKLESKPAKNEKYIGAPLYIWSFQSLPEEYISNYERVKGSLGRPHGMAY